MVKKSRNDERSDLLRKLAGRRFLHRRFAGLDALVACLPDKKPFPPSVQARIDEGPPNRWYPVEGGYVVKWPHDGSHLESADFSVEAGGWDHEHCDACNRTIRVGGLAWITARAPYYALCRYCFRRLAQIQRK